MTNGRTDGHEPFYSSYLEHYKNKYNYILSNNGPPRFGFDSKGFKAGLVYFGVWTLDFRLGLVNKPRNFQAAYISIVQVIEYTNSFLSNS